MVARSARAVPAAKAVGAVAAMGWRSVMRRS
jgi:hypothetical protein